MLSPVVSLARQIRRRRDVLETRLAVRYLGA